MRDAARRTSTPRLRQVVLDTEDALGLAEFYRQLLGLRYLEGGEPAGGGAGDGAGEGAGDAAGVAGAGAGGGPGDAAGVAAAGDAETEVAGEGAGAGGAADWLVLVDDDGARVLAFQRVASLPRATWPQGPRPQMMHLDFLAESLDDLREQHALALSLGASVLEDRSDDPEEAIVVFADPAGHPFCIFVLEE